MKSKSYFLYVAICLIWGTTWVIVKKSLIEGTPAIYGAGLRFFAAGIILLLISFFQKRSFLFVIIPHFHESIEIQLLRPLLLYVHVQGK